MADSAANRFMMPFALGATTLFGGATLLELITRGAVRSPDNASKVYFAIMGAFAGAGEINGWFQKISPAVQDISNPWLDHARKGGLFVSFWLLLYGATYALRLKDPSFPMPHELETITLEIIGLFFVTYSARSLRRARHGASLGAADDVGLSERQTLLDWLKTRPEGATIREIEVQLPGLTRRSLNRMIAHLMEQKAVLRDGHPRSHDTRYRTIA